MKSRISLLLLILSVTIPTRAGPTSVLWTVNGAFYHSITHRVEYLTGTVTTEPVVIGNDIRQNITRIDLTGEFMSFGAASQGGGFIDFCNKGMGPQVCQALLIVQDGTQFTDMPTQQFFSGTTIQAPIGFTLDQLAPFTGYGKVSLNLSPNDRMSLRFTDPPAVHPGARPVNPPGPLL